MKKIFFILFTISIFSCNKDKNTNSVVISPDSIVTYIKSKIAEEPDAILSVFANTVSSASIPAQVQISASLNTKWGDGSAIKQISLADINLQKSFDSSGKKYFFQTAYSGNKLFGQSAKINFLTDFFDLKTDFHSPELIVLQANNGTISKSKGYHLYWNKDENNGLPVQINVLYDDIATHFFEPSLPKVNGVIQFSKFVQDNGEYVIEPSELLNFPSKGIVSISITRGNFTYQKSNDKNILIYCLSMDTNPVFYLAD